MTEGARSRQPWRPRPRLLRHAWWSDALHGGSLHWLTERSTDGVALTQTALGPFLAGAFHRSALRRHVASEAY